MPPNERDPHTLGPFLKCPHHQLAEKAGEVGPVGLEPLAKETQLMTKKAPSLSSRRKQAQAIMKLGINSTSISCCVKMIALNYDQKYNFFINSRPDVWRYQILK